MPWTAAALKSPLNQYITLIYVFKVRASNIFKTFPQREFLKNFSRNYFKQRVVDK